MDDGRFVERFALGTLATWRLTHLFAEEDGPGDLVVRLRVRAGDRWQGRLMDCFYCLSVWTAAPVALTVVRRRRDVPIALLALSGAACLLERATGAGQTIQIEGGARDVLWGQTECAEAGDDGSSEAAVAHGDATGGSAARGGASSASHVDDAAHAAAEHRGAVGHLRALEH